MLPGFCMCMCTCVCECVRGKKKDTQREPREGERDILNMCINMHGCKEICHLCMV